MGALVQNLLNYHQYLNRPFSMLILTLAWYVTLMMYYEEALRFSEFHIMGLVCFDFFSWMFWKFTRSNIVLVSLDAIKLSNYCLQSNQFCFDIFFLLPFWGVSQTTYSVIKLLFELSQGASKPNECNSTTEFLKVTLNAALPAVCTSLVSLEGFLPLRSGMFQPIK